MTITFENNNDIIIYALEKIIDYARKNQYIFVVQSVWWIASIIGLEKGLVTHIDNLCIQSEVYQAPAIAGNNPSGIHPDRLLQLEEVASGIEGQPGQSLSISGSEESRNTEDIIHDQVLDNCERFLQESAFERKKVAKRNLKVSKKLLKTRPKKNYKTQTEGIEVSELRRRKAANKCQRWAWPQEMKRAHKTIDCFWWPRLEKGMAPFPKKRY